MPLEWLIDIIKEWVIAKAYATEAWVLAKLYLQKAEYPGYCMPVHVTGTCNPDVTCTYCRCGDYGGKPCYSQEDGSYFIWWDGSKWIIGTSVPGGPPTREFFRSDPSVFGNYSPMPGSSGTPTVSAGYKYLLTGFVDRGDPAGPDYPVGFWTADGTWRDLDLSSIIPPNASAVCLSIGLMASIVGNHLSLRTKGNVNKWNRSIGNTQTAMITFYVDWVVPLGPGQIIEYQLSAGNWVNITATVKGWWL